MADWAGTCAMDLAASTTVAARNGCFGSKI